MPPAPPKKERKVSAVDWLMLVLALVSVGLLVYVEFVPHTAETAHTVFLVDTGICAVFLVEFLFRWRARAGRSGSPCVTGTRCWA